MSNPNLSSPILTAMFAGALLASGNATAQNAAPSNPAQAAAHAIRQAAPQGPAPQRPTAKRMHKPMVGTKDMDKKSGHHTMADMDTDKDGRMSRTEFAAAHDGKTDEFAAHDANGDGFITQAEMDAHHAGMKEDHDAAETEQQVERKPHH